MYFDNKSFREWEDNTHIPDKITNMLHAICTQLGISEPEEETIKICNYLGVAIGFAKGFRISVCTSSYSDGPDYDYSKELGDWIKGLGFRISDSYGDNGMDSSTNWHDTYWFYDYIYEDSIIHDDFKRLYDDEEIEYGSPMDYEY